MNKLQQRYHDRFARAAQFIEARSGDFAETSRILSLKEELDGVLETLGSSGRRSRSAEGEQAPAGSKLAALNALRESLSSISNTAQVIEIHEDGFQNTYALPDKRRKDELVKTARQFMESAGKQKELFLSYEMRPDFLNVLEDRIAGYEAVSAPGSVSRVDRSAATEAIARGQRIAESLSVLLRNKYDGDEATLQSWNQQVGPERRRAARRGAKSTTGRKPGRPRATGKTGRKPGRPRGSKNKTSQTPSA